MLKAVWCDGGLFQTPNLKLDALCRLEHCQNNLYSCCLPPTIASSHHHQARMWSNKPDCIPETLLELETCINIATQLPKIVDGSSIVKRIKHKVRCLSEEPIRGTEHQQLAALECLVVARNKLADCCELLAIDLLQFIQERIAVLDIDHPTDGRSSSDIDSGTDQSGDESPVATHAGHSLPSEYCVPLLSADIKPIGDDDIYLVDPLFLLSDRGRKHYIIYQDTKSSKRHRKPVTFDAEAIERCKSEDGERLSMGLIGGAATLHLCFEEEADKASFLRRLVQETDLML